MNTHTIKHTFTKNGNKNSSFPCFLLFPRCLFTSTFVFHQPSSHRDLNEPVWTVPATPFSGTSPRPRQRPQQQSVSFEVMTSFDHAEGLPELVAMRNHAPRIHLHNGIPIFFFSICSPSVDRCQNIKLSHELDNIGRQTVLGTIQLNLYAFFLRSTPPVTPLLLLLLLGKKKYVQDLTQLDRPNCPSTANGLANGSLEIGYATTTTRRRQATYVGRYLQPHPHKPNVA